MLVQKSARRNRYCRQGRVSSHGQGAACGIWGQAASVLLQALDRDAFVDSCSAAVGQVNSQEAGLGIRDGWRGWEDVQMHASRLGPYTLRPHPILDLYLGIHFAHTLYGNSYSTLSITGEPSRLD
nr:hypothetical protein CFP56_19366 [Quercus suber]